MKRLRRWYLRFKIASYTQDALYLTETAERCKVDAVRARAKAEELRRQLVELCAKAHRHVDSVVFWLIVPASVYVLWAYGTWRSAF